MCHPGVLTGGPPQPVSSWGSWGKDGPCERSSNPSLTSHVPTRAWRAGEEAYSYHITSPHFIFFYFIPSSLTSKFYHLLLPSVDDLILTSLSKFKKRPHLCTCESTSLMALYSLSSVCIILCIGHPHLPSCYQGSARLAPNISPSTHEWDSSPCHLFKGLPPPPLSAPFCPASFLTISTTGFLPVFKYVIISPTLKKNKTKPP